MTRSILAALALLAACPSADTAVDTGTGTDGTDPDTGTARPEWTAALLADVDGGQQLRLATAPDGQLIAAWFANAPVSDGLCDEIAANPPERLRYPLVAALGGPDAWALEEVARPVVALTPTGLDLALDPSGAPVIAFTGGTPQGQYCGGNDAVVATRSGAGWTQVTAAAESGESNTGLPASDAGFVVGHWPAIAFDPAGHAAVLHRDVHYGALQRDDEYRADAELTWSDGAGWSHEAVDAGQGAGAYGQLRFAADGQPVAVYVVPLQGTGEQRLGVWAAKRGADGAWARVQLHAGMVGQEVAVDLSPAGVLSVAFYSADDLEPRLRRLSDLTRLDDPSAWTSERVGAALYDEGAAISIARLPDERLALAYHRCKRASDTSDTCDANEEAVVVALQGGAGWTHEVAHRGAYGACGGYTALAVAGAELFLAFPCTDQVGGAFVVRPWLARRPL